ncbi:hypothetical protein C8Q78DRAFT_1007887 [Trametes maxima]|nr:hypothetical protein C8Q78DRAFT_1007887 [Trametes maxima]
MPTEVRLSSRVNEDTLFHARKLLLAEIEMHADAIVQLKGRINNLSPTTRLPPEILSEIFTLVAVDNYDARRWHYCGSSHAYKWIALTHVCRAWRDIALNTPRLWSRVVITRPDAAMAALARSRKAPLWLTSVLLHPEDFRATMLCDTLRGESTRLKELNISGPSRLVQMLSAGWTTPAITLEKLTLSSDFPQCDRNYVLPSMPVSAEIFSREVPRLQHLEIHRIAIDWPNPLFCSTLRTLAVHSRYDMPASVKEGEFRKLLDALERMVSLENLQLNEAIPRLLDDAATMGRLIALPNLRRLDLFADASESANLFRHLSLPIDVQMIINGRNEKGADDLVRVFSDQLSDSTPLCIARLAPLYSSQVCVKGWRSFVDPRDPEAPEPDIQLFLDALSPLSRSLQALVTESTFFSQLYHFEIQCASRNWSWSALFGRMPELRVLSVIGHPEYGLLPALSAVCDDDEDHAGIVPLPKLHTLELEGLRFGCPHSDHESQYLEKLIDYLAMRCNHGAPILRIVLRCCVNATSGDVARLRDIVPDVQWDGRENIEEILNEREIDDEAAEEPEEILPDVFTPLFPDDYYDDDDDDDDLEFWMIPFGF